MRAVFLLAVGLAVSAPISAQDSLVARINELEQRVAVLEAALTRLLPPLSAEDLESIQLPPEAEELPASDPARPIQISLTSKGFASGQYGDDRITLAFSFASGLAKDVRAFTGVVVLQDLFERDIMRVNLTVEDPLPARGTVSWEGGIDYNQFMDPHRRLRTVDQADLVLKFELAGVIFTDGTRQSFGGN